jgi:hypothetical protein
VRGWSDKWHTIGRPETDPHVYCSLIFDSGPKEIQRIKASFLNKHCWKDLASTSKKKSDNLGTGLILFTHKKF